MPSKRSTYIPYIPGHPPTADKEQLCRATWDELYAIAQSLIDLDRPVSVTVNTTEVIAVDDTENWTRMFDDGTGASWEQPLGQLDTSTGVYTCPQSGLYQFFVDLRVPAFSAPGNKEFYASIRTTRTAAIGGVTETIDTSGGSDEFPITVIAGALIPCSQGDTFYFDAAIVHDNKTGTSDCGCYLMVVRQSAIK